jgi:hypothetical protein
MSILCIIAIYLSILLPRLVWAVGQDHGAIRSLRTESPQLLSLQITQVGPNIAHTVVEYARDERLGARLTLGLANGPVTFIRQLDGRYAADIQLTNAQIADLSERNKRLETLASHAIHDEYVGRVLVGSVLATPLSVFSLGTTESGQGQLPPPAEPGALAYLAVGALVPDTMSVLMITDRKVVGDATRTWDPCDATSRAANGVWTFGHLIRSLPGVTDAAKLTETWLKTWTTDQPVGNTTVPARPGISDVLSRWPRTGTGALDLDQAPLRLLAIVNRPDLADNLTFPAGATPTPGSAGELRFVFDVAPIDTAAKQCAIMKFQVIVEYQVTASTCDDVKQWAQGWIDLGALGRGSAAYNQALEKITEAVVVNGKGTLAQVRTNEIDLAQSHTALWEMREFGLTGSGASLALSERNVRRTPLDTLNHTENLAVLVNGEAGDILQNTYEVTGANAGVNPQMNNQTFWDSNRSNVTEQQISEPAVRFNFSLNACTGCHARETCTHFSQVVPGPAGSEACLSAFLAGGHNVPDPVFCTTAQNCSTDTVCPPSPTPTVAGPVATPTPATPSGTPTAAIPTNTTTPSLTPTGGLPMATPTPVMTATATATATYNACSYAPNDLERRRQVLDQLTMCIFPNGYVRLNAVH